MNKTFQLLLSCLLILSCEKNNSDEYHNIQVGNSHLTCYGKLQDLYIDNKILNLVIVGVEFQTIEHFNEIIPWYSEFQIVDAENDAFDTISVCISSDTVEYISDKSLISPLTGGPTPLLCWPDIAGSHPAIVRGDTRENIYSKLLQLEEEGILENRLEKIIYRTKDLTTGLDPYSSVSGQWNILEFYRCNALKQRSFHLHFTNDQLERIEIKDSPAYCYD